MAKIVKELTIEWSLGVPVYLDPLDWWDWDFDPQVQEIPQILEIALSQNLPRTTGWDLRQIPHVRRPPYLGAARVYKRGVKVLTDVEEPCRTVSGSYPIRFWESETFAPLLSKDEFLIVDGGVRAFWPELRARADYVFEGVSEKQKSLESVQALMDKARGRGSWCVIGGGILSDLAGFAASEMEATFRFIPTSLLAMVDACVGGKTGVNVFPFGKNLVGSFAFPVAVEIWAGWLQTLPTRDLLAGGSECLKHALLTTDPDLLKGLSKSLADQDTAQIIMLLPELISVKAEIIMRDPTEASERAVLNLGHTLAHALEAYFAHAEGLRHGEAVGFGLVYALMVSKNVGFLKGPEFEFMLGQLLQSACVPSPKILSQVVFEDLLPYLKQDKKQTVRHAPLSNMVLLRGQGEVVRGKGWVSPVGRETLATSWRELLSLASRI